MLCEILKPEQRLALSREGHWHPAERIVEIPDGDAHASIDLNTGSHGLDRAQLVLMRETHGEGV